MHPNSLLASLGRRHSRNPSRINSMARLACFASLQFDLDAVEAFSEALSGCDFIGKQAVYFGVGFHWAASSERQTSRIR
jgi:hypothetical protein